MTYHTPSIETRHAHLNRLLSYRSAGNDQIAVIKLETGSGLVKHANMKTIERDLDWSSAAGHVWLQEYSGSGHDIETIWVDARWFEESSDKAAGQLMDYELIIANDLVLDEGDYEQVLNKSK